MWEGCLCIWRGRGVGGCAFGCGCGGVYLDRWVVVGVGVRGVGVCIWMCVCGGGV